MRKLLFVLLIIFVATLKKRPIPPPHRRFDPIRTLNVTKAVGFILRNNTEKYKEEVAKLDIPQKMKDLAAKEDLSKKRVTFSDLKLDYNNKTGGKAEGEFFLLQRITGRKNKTLIECYYGTAVATLKPLTPYVETVCHKNHLGKKICRNVTHPVNIKEKEIKGRVERRMRMEIKNKVDRRQPVPRPPRNKTTN